MRYKANQHMDKNKYQALIAFCKDQVQTCYKTINPGSTDGIALVHCQVQIDQALFNCLKTFAKETNTDMEALINWVEEFQQEHLEKHLAALQGDVEKEHSKLH